MLVNERNGFIRLHFKLIHKKAILNHFLTTPENTKIIDEHTKAIGRHCYYTDQSLRCWMHSKVFMAFVNWSQASHVYLAFRIWMRETFVNSEAFVLSKIKAQSLRSTIEKLKVKDSKNLTTTIHMITNQMIREMSAMEDMPVSHIARNCIVTNTTFVSVGWKAEWRVCLKRALEGQVAHKLTYATVALVDDGTGKTRRIEQTCTRNNVYIINKANHLL